MTKTRLLCYANSIDLPRGWTVLGVYPATKRSSDTIIFGHRVPKGNVPKEYDELRRNVISDLNGLEIDCEENARWEDAGSGIGIFNGNTPRYMMMLKRREI